MALFFPQGPINAGDKCCMGYWDDKDFYVLTDVSSLPITDFPSNYVFQSAVGVDSSGNLIIPDDVKSLIAVFEVDGSQTSFTMTENFPSTGYMGVTTIDSDTFFNKNPNVKTNFVASQSTYADWGDPTIFLSGVQYTVLRTSTPTIIKSYVLDPQQTGVANLKTIRPFFIPIVYYTNCISSGEPYGIGSTCQQVTDPYTCIIEGYCGLSNQTSVGPCAKTPGPVWTTIQDALDNHPYMYCPASQTTCQPNCKAPCSNGYDYCQWDGTQFQCQFNPNTLFTGEWWTKSWFIASVIIVVILIFILIVVATSGGTRRR